MICKAYKKLVVIAIQEEYLTIISNQIKEIFGDVLSIRAITVKDIAMKSIHTDELVLLSGEFILQIVKSFLPDRAHFVIAKRSLNFVNMKELLKLPKGKHILVVNDTKINTEETIRELKESVFEHYYLSLIHISEPTRLGMISYAVFCLKKKKKKIKKEKIAH